MNDEIVTSYHESEIAIIGLKGRFPGARNVDELWKNLRDGVESISFFSDQELEAEMNPVLSHDPHYVKAGAVLADIELFDAAFFEYSHREAELIDPQQRLFLECAWEVLESAGYDSERLAGRIGVYAGVDTNTYLFNLLANPAVIWSAGGYQAIIANDKDHVSTRVSYKLNLKGPSITIQTACSTSLVAVHVACQSLLNGECDMALAGGVSISVPQEAGYLYQEGMILSPDGHCRAFDARAQGTVGGNGMGIIMLKRLADALADGDCIHAVIRGSAVNNDGSTKVGYTAPSVDGQAEVIAEALAMARVEPETITFIEAHGTGTPLGDPVEIAALTQAFRTGTEKKGFCAVGSVKTNLGHLSTAAGVAGLIKTVLALKHQEIPPSLHFERPNPKIDFANSPFYVNATLRKWQTDGTPRRAGVSSFGIGGTNAHVVLEEAPAIEPPGESRPWQLLLLSAKTSSALEAATANLAQHLQQHPALNLADVAYTLQVGRRSFNHRRALVCRDRDDAVTALETLSPERVFTRFQEPAARSVVFMFPGQGAQYVNMGLGLYQTEPAFREQVDRCSELLQPELELDPRQILYPGEGESETATRQLNQTRIAQPALFVIEYALARLLMTWGVRPQALIGHSSGEYVAACLASVLSLQDALALVAVRGRLMQELPGGAMLAVALPETQIRPLLGEQLSLAAHNAPALCVVSGPTDAVQDLQNRLVEQGVDCRRLHTSHAFHSQMMTPILEPFARRVKAVKLKPPQIPYVSNVTGSWATASETTDAGYWVAHLRQTVRFAEGVRGLWQEPGRIFLEVGPGRTLASLANRQAQQPGERVVLSTLPHPRERRSDVASVLNALGQCWMAGAPVDWTGFYVRERRRRLPLPTYPFERRRYWIESPARTQDDRQKTETGAGPTPDDVHRGDSLPSHQRPDLPNAYVAPRDELERNIATIWQELLGVEQVGVYDDFYALGGHSLMATRLISRLQSTFPFELPLRDLFASLTVASMAEVIGQVLIEKIEALSEEQIQRLLQGSSSSQI
jgi:acyl transferase domain-containing protein